VGNPDEGVGKTMVRVFASGCPDFLISFVIVSASFLRCYGQSSWVNWGQACLTPSCQTHSQLSHCPGSFYLFIIPVCTSNLPCLCACEFSFSSGKSVFPPQSEIVVKNKHIFC